MNRMGSTQMAGYCQQECALQSPAQPPVPQPDFSAPWGMGAGGERGRQQVDQEAMQSLQMQQLYLENQRRKQQIEQQQRQEQEIQQLREQVRQMQQQQESQPRQSQSRIKETVIPTKMDARYRDNHDGTVTDLVTNLQWMRCSFGQTWVMGNSCQGDASEYTWDEASSLPKKFAGHSDWRLPQLEELRGLIYCTSGLPKKWAEDTCYGQFQAPTIMLEAFPNTPNTSKGFWTGNVSASGAWVVFFKDGHLSDGSRTRHFAYIRLVRSNR